MEVEPTSTKRRTRGPGRTDREDWLQEALAVMISDGVDAIKIASLSERLGCARSSFYWYFKNRDEILSALLDHWQTLNTRTIVVYAAEPADTINLALTTLFRGLLDPKKFDPAMDFAVREWARRDPMVRRAVDVSDTARLDAISAMFTRFGYVPGEAAIRARIVYYTQLGYETLDREGNRLDRVETGPHYLLCMTGIKPTEEEVAAITQLAKDLQAPDVQG
jgi:AcrR family transcriptional regulator